MEGLTLARKLDRVQRNTVSRSRHMPSVRLAMPARPILARKPPFSTVGTRTSIEEPVDAARSAASAERRLLSGASERPSTSAAVASLRRLDPGEAITGRASMGTVKGRRSGRGTFAVSAASLDGLSARASVPGCGVRGERANVGTVAGASHCRDGGSGGLASDVDGGR